MEKTKNCTIRLINKNYEIKCPESETDNLQQAAQKLNEVVNEQQKKFKHLDPYQALLLAALHLSHDLVLSKREQEKRRQQLSKFINTFEDKVNVGTLE